jgi:hypothetical protein
MPAPQGKNQLFSKTEVRFLWGGHSCRQPAFSRLSPLLPQLPIENPSAACIARDQSATLRENQFLEFRVLIPQRCSLAEIHVPIVIPVNQESSQSSIQYFYKPQTFSVVEI